MKSPKPIAQIIECRIDVLYPFRILLEFYIRDDIVLSFQLHHDTNKTVEYQCHAIISMSAAMHRWRWL